MKKLETRELLGFSWVRANVETVVDVLVNQVSSGTNLVTVATPNPEQVMLAREDDQFGELLRRFDYRLPDGAGIIWASSRLSKTKHNSALTNRLAGVDVVRGMLERRVFELGPVLVVGGRGYEGRVVKLKTGTVTISDVMVTPPTAGSNHTARSSLFREPQDDTSGHGDPSTALTLREPQGDTGHGDPANGRVEPYSPKPAQNVLYWLPGYEDAQQPTKAEEQRVEQVIAQLKPKVVLVALGAPWQERWIIQQQSLLEKNGARLAMTVGGAFDMLTGLTPRAPHLMRQLKLEWLWRLVLQPWRWKRQLALLTFIRLVLSQK